MLGASFFGNQKQHNKTVISDYGCRVLRGLRIERFRVCGVLV